MKSFAILITLLLSVAVISDFAVAIDTDGKQYNIDSSYDKEKQKNNGNDDTEFLDVRDFTFSDSSNQNSYLSNVISLPLLLKKNSPYSPRAPPLT